MLWKTLVVFFFMCIFSRLPAQPRWLVSSGFDLVRSDRNAYFRRIQIGVEADCFFTRSFAATAGLEVWTGDAIIPVLGVRLSPTEDAFVRIRALPGEDVSIGGGFARPLANNFCIEAMADFYFAGNIAIRAGLAYDIPRRSKN